MLETVGIVALLSCSVAVPFFLVAAVWIRRDNGG